MSLEKIGHYSLTNPSSVYDEEALTALELAGRTASKVNEAVDAFNNLETTTNDHLAVQDADIKNQKEVVIPNKIKNEVQSQINNGTFDKQIDSYIGNLGERVDNLVNNVPEGGTTSDAELIDIRVSGDGTTYANAGEAVRAQVNDLRTKSNHTNLLNLNRLRFGYLNETDDSVILTGGQSEIGRRFEMFTEDFIPVENSSFYYFQLNALTPIYGDPWVAFSCYDANKNYIRRIAFDSENVKIRFGDYNVNISYVRVSYRSYMGTRPKFEHGGYGSLPLSDFENHVTMKDLSVHGFLSGDGTLGEPTAPVYENKERTTNFLKVEPGEKYHVFNFSDGFMWCGVCFYDSVGVNVNGRTVSYNPSFTIEVPEQASFMRVSARTYAMKGFGVFNVNDDSELYHLYKQVGEKNVKNACVKAVAHRGLSSKAPENTLFAYKYAKKAGFDYAECDVEFTSDSVPVLLHDNTIDRTSNGSGDVSAMTLATARTFDFGSWFHEEFTYTPMPTFEEFISLCRNISLHPYIELKDGTEAQIGQLVDIVNRHGMLRKVTWICFAPSMLAHVIKYDPGARLGYLISSGITDEVIQTALSLRTGENEVFMDSCTYSGEEIQKCMDARLPLEVWTINTEEGIKNLPVYVSGVTTDTLIAGDILYNNNIGG